MGVEENINASDYAKEILELGAIRPKYNGKNELTELKFRLSDLLSNYGTAEDKRPWYVKLLLGKKKHKEELERSARQNLEKSITDWIKIGDLKNDYEEIQEYKQIKAGKPQDPKIFKFEDKNAAECFYRTSVFANSNLADRDVFTADIKKKGDLIQVVYQHYEINLDPTGEIQHYCTKNEEFYNDKEIAHQKALEYLKSGLKSIFSFNLLDASKLSFQVVEKSH